MCKTTLTIWIWKQLNSQHKVHLLTCTEAFDHMYRKYYMDY